PSFLTTGALSGLRRLQPISATPSSRGDSSRGLAGAATSSRRAIMVYLLNLRPLNLHAAGGGMVEHQGGPCREAQAATPSRCLPRLDPSPRSASKYTPRP